MGLNLKMVTFEIKQTAMPHPLRIFPFRYRVVAASTAMATAAVLDRFGQDTQSEIIAFEEIDAVITVEYR